jgi:spore coat protein U-like protein
MRPPLRFVHASICVVAIAAMVAVSTPARALGLACTFTIGSLNFGTIDLTANTTYDTTSTFSANCTGGVPLTTARVCPNINSGSGGTNTGDPRFMLNGANQLQYNLFQDAARTTVWGSYLWAFPAYTAPQIDIPLDILGNGSATRTVYGRVYAGQQAVSPGSYTSSFSGSNTQIAYNVSLLGTCAQIGSTNATAAPFTVNATYSATCAVAATTLNFGTAGVLNSTVNGSSTLTTTCSATTPYTIGLDGGNASASDPTQRKMSKGSEMISYGLYRDAARSQAWGSTAGVNTAAGTGSGLGQAYTVYGRVPTQTTPSPGSYTDTIVATVTY